MSRLTIVLSGSKCSGKTSAAKTILAEFLNRKIGKPRFVIDKVGKEVLLRDAFNNNKVINADYINDDLQSIYQTYSVKLYNFADPLKELCINILGLSPIQCYGTDDDKNTSTHLSWDDLPLEIREKYRRPRRGVGGNKPAAGLMTAKEVMQIVHQDFFESIDPNCWSRGIFALIGKDKYELAILDAGNNPSCVTMGTEIGAKAIRLTRHSEKHPVEDALPLGEYHFILDNNDMTLLESQRVLKKYLATIFNERGL